jgi:hypothetical protein
MADPSGLEPGLTVTEAEWLHLGHIADRRDCPMCLERRVFGGTGVPVLDPGCTVQPSRRCGCDPDAKRRCAITAALWARRP